MDPNTKNLDSPQEDSPTLTPTPTPTPSPLLSISLSFLNPHSLLHPNTLSPFPTNLKLPSQITTLSLSAAPTQSKPPKSKKPLNSSLTPLLSPLPTLPIPPSFPTPVAACRRVSLLWFRCDLRLHDNEALSAAHSDSLSLLPVFLFDPRDFGKSPSGFDRTGLHCASFLLCSVHNLRDFLRHRGSDLVRVGRPESVLPSLARSVGADAIYAHCEVSHDEVCAEERVRKAMEEEGVEVKYFWGSTLYHLEDLSFALEDMSSNYGGFREKVKGVAVELRWRVA